MSQYKVPQDVEAEDKIIGALTLKQFIYAVIGIAYGFLTFSIFKGAPLLFVIIGVPPTLLFLMLGLWRRQDQPFEAYFLALISYFVRPRARLWQKEPIADLFNIEPDKVVQQVVTKDPGEVRGQLDKLVKIVDSRGWAAKQPELQEPTMHSQIDAEGRIETAPMPQEIITEPTDIHLEDDILDFKNNPTAQNLDVLIEDSVRSIREEAMQKMRQQPPTQAPPTSTSEMNPSISDAILKLNNLSGDLSVSQIAAQAGKQVLQPGQAVSLRDA